MRKLPVLAVVGASYRFAFRSLWGVFRAALVPTLASIVFLFVASAVIAAFEPGRVAAALLLIIVVPIMLGLWALSALPVQRMILFAAPREPLRLDRTTGRYLLIAIVLYAVIAILDPYSGLFFAPQGRNETSRAAGLVLAMAGLCFGVLRIRLGLLYPASIAEGRVDLGGTLGRTRWNWWRLWWAQALGLVPPVIVLLMLGGAMSIAAREALVVKAAVFALAIPAIVIGALVLLGMSAAIDAFAYKALTGAPLDESIAAPLRSPA